MNDKENILLFPKKIFNLLKKKIHKLNIKCDDDIAFTILTPNDIYKYTIIINNDIFKNMTKDERMITILHEIAHSIGIIDEEEADRWVLKNLNSEQEFILTSQWKLRHGYEYKPL